MNEQTEDLGTDILRLREDHVIVLVDDERGILSALERVFRRQPFHVLTVSHPRDLWKILDEQPVSLVLSDQSMAEMQGTDLLRGVMLRSPTTTCVMLTGFPSVDLKKECEHLGIRELIEKPWDDDELRRTIRLLLREREL